ncbi:DNA-binding protein [Candidatus Microgenomates bacterium]|nr:DNA-binding protein [Candidatus Microgenomates bacterium]
MQAKRSDKKIWILRLEKGEEIISAMSKFCRENKINGGFFYGIGACDMVRIAHYDEISKKYSSRKFKKALELLNITGNIAREKELIIHAHVTLADNQFHVFGGHLLEGRISITSEIFLCALPTLKKKFDPETGLKLLDLQ